MPDHDGRSSLVSAGGETLFCEELAGERATFGSARYLYDEVEPMSWILEHLPEGDTHSGTIVTIQRR